MSASRSARTWRVAEWDQAKTRTLAKGLDVPPLVAHLLALRGIETIEQGQAFLNPSFSDVLEPFRLTDMRAAVDRIEAARRNGERVLVFGDYDVDGIAGTAILINALRRFGVADCSYGMPSRLIEGYGISPEHVEAAQKDGVHLIVTVDNGINAREAADMARRTGVDLIVTDHHALEGALPDACAVVNPKREPEPCPARYAAGAAVAFHLAHALTGQAEDLDLVALGTVADIVPLRGENRALVTLGLQDMVRRRRVGLAELARVAGLRIDEISSEKIAFQLAPRLNAAGRLGDGMGPVELLLTDSQPEAARMAAELNRANEDRRAIERTILDEASAELDATVRVGRNSIVLARRAWHPGVIGVVASRLYAMHQHPVVLVAVDEEGVGRGSARSHDDFDMVSALSECQEHLVRFGGHSAAAGLTLREERIEAFTAAFEAAAARRLHDVPPLQTIDVDTLIAFSEIDPQLVKNLERLEPFGAMNRPPVLATCGVTLLPQSFRELRGGHAKFMAQHASSMLDIVAFSMAALVQEYLGARPVDVAFTPRLNTWRGNTTVQLLLKDIRPSES